MHKENKELIFKDELDYLVESFGSKSQDGAKEALRKCQEIFGCVSLSHQKQIGQAFELEEKVVATIMKFIPSIKESIVEYEVVCCTGSRCAKNGSVEVLKEIRKVLGLDFEETSDDGKIRLTTQNCFKKCNMGPNIMVNGEYYHYMDREKTNKLMTAIKEDKALDS